MYVPKRRDCMSNKKKPTKKEHFIPRFYLNGFSNNEIIYQNCVDNLMFDKDVPTNSICYIKNLYEFKDENGEILYTNKIEECLHIIETKVSKIINDIERKSNDKSYLNKVGFLSPEEKSYLIIFSVLQLLRHPENIKIATEIIKDMPLVTSDKVARTIVLLQAFPVFEYNPEDDKNFLNRMLQMVSDMHIQIYKSYTESFITSDNPCNMIFCDENKSRTQADMIVFPLTSDLLLFMAAKMPENKRNTLIECPAEEVRSFNKGTIIYAYSWVFSKEVLTPQLKKWIKKKQRKKQKLADAVNKN